MRKNGVYQLVRLAKRVSKMNIAASNQSILLPCNRVNITKVNISKYVSSIENQISATSKKKYSQKLCQGHLRLECNKGSVQLEFYIFSTTHSNESQVKKLIIGIIYSDKSCFILIDDKDLCVNISFSETTNSSVL